MTPTGVDAVWLMGLWERSPIGVTWPSRSRISWRRSTPRCPMSSTATSSAPPTASAATRSIARFGGRQGLAVARAALAHAGCASSSISCPTTWPRTIRGCRPPGVLRPGQRRGPRARAASFCRWATRSSRVAAPLTSRHGPTSLSSTRSCPDCGGRPRRRSSTSRASRRRALRHGDAVAQRRVRTDVGRTSGRWFPERGVLDRGHRRGSSRAPGLHLCRRGLLGPRVGPGQLASTTATTSVSTTDSSTTAPSDTRPSPRRPRLPAAPAALPREPRRAARRTELTPRKSRCSRRDRHTARPTLWHEGQFEGQRSLAGLPRPSARGDVRRGVAAFPPSTCLPRPPAFAGVSGR